MSKLIEVGGLTVVTDRIAPTRAPNPQELLDVMPSVVAVLSAEGGAIQLRDKDATDEQMVLLGRKIMDMAEGVPVIVNDRPQVAVEIGAQGVHVGQNDLLRTSASEVRAIIGSDMMLGISAATVDEALTAEKDGADYVGLGPIFPTRTKTDAVPPVGTGRLREVRDAISLPIVAIGGITHQNAAEVIRAGADNIAVIGTIFRAENPAAAARRLIAIAKRR
jgi:thiamine-phosphate diphosphorylase